MTRIPQPFTSNGQAAADILAELLDHYSDMTDGERHTSERTYGYKRVEQIRKLLALIPDAEVEAACLVLPGTTREQARAQLAFAAQGGVPIAEAA